MATILGLLRHGQTDWNIDFRLQGVTDIPLNEMGHAQARTAAAQLNPENWDVLVTSPLSRAKATADYVASRFGNLQPVVSEQWLERSFGQAEGLTHEEWKERFNADAALVPGAETLAELNARAQSLLDSVQRDYSGQRILAVSHGALIRVLLALVSSGEIPRNGERLGNACLNLLTHQEDQGWALTVYEPKPLDENTARNYELI